MTAVFIAAIHVHSNRRGLTREMINNRRRSAERRADSQLEIEDDYNPEAIIAFLGFLFGGFIMGFIFAWLMGVLCNA